MKLEFRQTVTCNHLTLAMVCKTIPGAENM